MAISFLGVGSGLELQSMLDQLVQVATKPKVEQLGKKEAQVNSNISGLGAVKSVLADFQDSVDALKSSSLYGQNTATLVQPSAGDVVSVTAGANAVAGNYSISTEQLAEGSRAQSSWQSADATLAEGNNGNLTFSAGASTFSIAVSTGDSLEDIISKINDADDNFGISATIVDGYLVYKSSITGSSNNLVVNNDNASLDNYSTVANGGGAGGVSIALGDESKDAKIIVDGITITNDTNTFENAVTGLTITALSEDPGNSAQLTVAKDTGSISSAVSAMASAYNDVMEELKKQSGSNDEDGNFVPGPMFGSSILRQIDSMLSNTMTSIVSAGAGNLNSMYAVGIDLESDGTLSVDSGRLSESLINNFDDFEALFSGENGFATGLSSKLDSYLEYGGIIDSQEKNYQYELDSIDEAYTAHIEYITSYKETLKKQFASLDSTVSTLQATLNYVTSQLANLPSSKS